MLCDIFRQTFFQFLWLWYNKYEPRNTKIARLNKSPAKRIYSMFENDLWKNAEVKALTDSVNASNRIKRVTRMFSYVANFICKHELRNAKFVRLIEWFIKNTFNVTDINPRSTDKKVLGVFQNVQEIISCCI